MPVDFYIKVERGTATPPPTVLAANETVTTYADGQFSRISHSAPAAADEYVAGTPPVGGAFFTNSYQGLAVDAPPTAVIAYWNSGNVQRMDCATVGNATQWAADIQYAIDNNGGYPS